MMNENMPIRDNQPPENETMPEDEVASDKEDEEDHEDSHEHEEVSPPPEDLAFDQEKARNTFSQNCARCHGVNLQGGGAFPSLQEVGRTHTKDDILYVIRTGPGIMPANIVTGEDAENLAKWLWTKR